MCYLQKVSTLLKNGNVCQPSSLQTNVLREKKTKGKSLEETGVSNWRLRLDELDQAKPFSGKTFHQSSSEKYIADSAAGDSVQRSVSMRGGSLVKTFPSPFRVYPLFLLSTDSNDVLISTLELKLEQQPLNNLGPQGSNIFIPSLPPPPLPLIVELKKDRNSTSSLPFFYREIKQPLVTPLLLVICNGP